MPLSMHQTSVPAFVRGLKVLSALLDKGAAHAAEAGTDPAALTTARLIEDMHPLTSQIQRASDTSKLCIERLTGVDSPKMADEEQTFEQLKARIAATVAYLESVPESAFEGCEDKVIELSFGPNFKQAFTGISYLLTFALPNFYFHVTTAYAILRANGVQVGKRDYLAPPA